MKKVLITGIRLTASDGTCGWNRGLLRCGVRKGNGEED